PGAGPARGEGAVVVAGGGGLMPEFVGKVALVTGGSLGIGAAVVERLVAGGASVVFCGREDVTHPGALGVRADVTVAAEVDALVATTVERFGGLDIVVTSAGIQRYGTVEETSEALWDEVLGVNLKGVY